MKLLLDQNLSRRLLPRLESLFPQSSQVALLGLDRADDTEIWAIARKEEFAIVTKDADFVELSLMQGFPPKVIWLNLGNISNTEVATRLLAEADGIKSFLMNTTEGVLEIE